MVLSEFEWAVILAVFGLVSTLGGLAVAIISFFLKRTMNNVDGHGKDIQGIKESYASNESLEKTQAQLALHDKDINEIKRTYVTKGELREIKSELRDETKKLIEDVADIREHYIREESFLRTTSELRDEIRRIMNFLIQERGGRGNGQE